MNWLPEGCESSMGQNCIIITVIIFIMREAIVKTYKERKLVSSNSVLNYCSITEAVRSMTSPNCL